MANETSQAPNAGETTLMAGDENSSPLFMRAGSTKATVMAEPDTISPILTPLEQTHISNLHRQGSKEHRTNLSKRLAGRASISPLQSPDLPPNQSEQSDDPSSSQGTQTYRELHDNLIDKLSQWLHKEKSKRAKGGTHQHEVASPKSHPVRNSQQREDGGGESDSDVALEKLERILAENDNLAHRLLGGSSHGRPRFFPHRKSSNKPRLRRLSHTAGSSDTDYVDGDALVPSADVILDNSKTLGYTGGEVDSMLDVSRTISRSAKEEGWHGFKNEVIRLTHTLRLQGWRRVPLGSGSDIDIKRLSGALTNAVYVVTPPERFSKDDGTEAEATIGGETLVRKRRPRELLLRIYGPNVEHLIDREAELQILKRLARKRIGPRILGTFKNGRFEQYLHAKTLTLQDIRDPDTSKQIAKRMRELHDGIVLLDRERHAGPFVWQNWDKWVTYCTKVIQWIDQQMREGQVIASPTQEWQKRGFVCGTEWPRFRKAVEMYRKWLTKQYGGEQRIREKLVFAHNDTQYGNLLRVEPSGESPLLLPANEHKQLVVIDFEYANANLPGLEFANHFTEWCYDYLSPTAPFACNATVYPTPKEQERFISAYLQHVSHFSSPSVHAGLRKSTSSISAFMLDSRGPPSSYEVEEAAREEKWKKDIERLMKEARLWRVANSAQWVLWGIVQAKIPGMEAALEQENEAGLNHDGKADLVDGLPASDVPSPELHENGSEKSAEGGSEVDLENEYDCLAYSQERAFFFWGDLLELGLIQEEDLPENVLREAKRIPY